MNKRIHSFVSAKADGGDATLVRPSNWNAAHDIGIELINRTGGSLSSGDIVALSAANDESVILDDAAGKNRKYVVALATIADTVAGLFTDAGAWTMKVAGTVVRGNYLAKSATAKSLDDTGRAAATTTPIAGDVAIALTGIVGAGTIVGAFLGGGGGASFTKGADIASASALTVPSGVFYAHVTGTTTINTIGSLPAGTFLVLEFDGALTLTHSANLILARSLNHITTAGEIVTFVSEGSGVWRQVVIRGIHRAQYFVGANNDQGLAVRNAANTADLQLLTADTLDRGALGGSVTNVYVVNQFRCDLSGTGRLVIPVGASKWAT